jgi:hypothetical protein
MPTVACRVQTCTTTARRSSTTTLMVGTIVRADLTVAWRADCRESSAPAPPEWPRPCPTPARAAAPPAPPLVPRADPRLTDYETLLKNLSDLRDGKDAQVGRRAAGPIPAPHTRTPPAAFPRQCQLPHAPRPTARPVGPASSPAPYRRLPSPAARAPDPDPHLRLQGVAPRGLPPPARARRARGDRGGHLRTVGPPEAPHGGRERKRERKQASWVGRAPRGSELSRVRASCPGCLAAWMGCVVSWVGSWVRLSEPLEDGMRCGPWPQDLRVSITGGVHFDLVRRWTGSGLGPATAFLGAHVMLAS